MANVRSGSSLSRAAWKSASNTWRYCLFFVQFVLADFLVLVTARNERLAKAIADDVHLQLKGEGLLPSRMEGVQEARWVLLDYLDCVLHVFVPEAREHYRLEQLWGEAPHLEL